MRAASASAAASGTVSAMTASPQHGLGSAPEGNLDVLEPFLVLLFDDPVNTMGYVAAALREVLSVDGATAERLMMEAHTTGKAVVFRGSREEAEQVCTKLHGWTLHASVVQ